MGGKIQSFARGRRILCIFFTEDRFPDEFPLAVARVRSPGKNDYANARRNPMCNGREEEEANVEDRRGLSGGGKLVGGGIGGIIVQSLQT